MSLKKIGIFYQNENKIFFKISFFGVLGLRFFGKNLGLRAL